MDFCHIITFLIESGPWDDDDDTIHLLALFSPAASSLGMCKSTSTYLCCPQKVPPPRS